MNKYICLFCLSIFVFTTNILAQTQPRLMLPVGHTDWVYTATFSPDGQRIVTASDDNTAKLWDATRGKLLFSLDGHTERVNEAKFSPDGQRIVTASDDKTAKVWGATSGKLLYSLEGHTDMVISAAFSPDGQRIVTASADKTAKVWDATSGKLLYSLDGHTSSVISATFSPDGQRIVTGSTDNTAKLWDATSGKLLYSLDGHTERVNTATFSPDGQRIVTASWDKTGKVWDATSGKLLYSLEGHTMTVYTATFSPDGQRIVTASNDKTAKVWDATSGKLLVSLDGHTGPVFSATFSPDGQRIVTASYDYTAKVWDATSGKLLYSLEGHTRIFESATFSPDGQSIVTASYDKTAKVWDATSGKLLFSLEGHTDGVYSATFSHDGQRIVTASDDNTAKVWDATSGKMIKDIALNGTCYAIDFENNTLISHSNSMLTLWDMETGKEIYSFIAVDSSDYLVIDPYGRYDGTPGARDYLYFVCGTEVIDLAQMKDALYVPGLVEKIMSGQEINYPKLSDLDICDALPLIERSETDDRGYNYIITPRKLGLEYIEVYVNAKVVRTIPANQIELNDGKYYLKLDAAQLEKHFVPGSDNEVNVVGVVRQANSELRSRGAKYNFAPKEKTAVQPRLFAMVIGVNNYKDPKLNLKYPVKDSRDLGAAIEQSAKKLLGNNNVFMYIVNSEVTPGNGFSTPEKEGIRRAFADIGSKARPEDVILIFFAGHGVMEGETDKMFTFLTAEASQINLAGISTRELREWLSYDGPYKMLANKTILIFDACNSGQATHELMALARSDDDTKRIRQVEDLKDKSGMFILAASAPNQYAYELPQYEQGLLTYSLLYVLKNNPDILDDGRFLNVQKWFLETEKYLHLLVSNMGYEQNAQPFGTANIRIGEVDEDVRNSIHLAEEKPVVMCANVLNTDSFNDDLQLKDLINKELSSISERGVKSMLVFARTETPGANKINIMYQVQGEQVVCQVRLLKGSESLHQANISGNKEDLPALVNKIIEEVVGFAK